MKFTLTVPKTWNFTPAALMKKYADENSKYIFTCNRYFENCLYDRATDAVSYYDHLNIKHNADDTDTVTVYLNTMKCIVSHYYGSHTYMKLELNSEIYEVDNYCGTDCTWKQFKTTADGTDKRDAVIEAFYILS